MKYIQLIILFILIGYYLPAQQFSYAKLQLKPLSALQQHWHNMIDRKELINDNDSILLMNLGRLNEQSFGKDLLKHASVVKKERAYSSGNKKTEVITFMVLKEPVKLNCLVLKESFQFEQAIENMDIVLSNHGMEVRKITITTVGQKRILTFPITEVSELSFIITSAKSKPHLEEVSGYLVDEKAS